MPAEAAAFAWEVITKTGPEGGSGRKNLLWAAGKLADWAIPLGLEPVPEILLHPSAAERFTRCAPGLSGVARRTLRSYPPFGAILCEINLRMGVSPYQMIGIRHGQPACMRRIVVSRWQLITPSSRRVCGGVFSSGACIGFRAGGASGCGIGLR